MPDPDPVSGSAGATDAAPSTSLFDGGGVATAARTVPVGPAVCVDCGVEGIGVDVDTGVGVAVDTRTTGGTVAVSDGVGSGVFSGVGVSVIPMV